MKALWQTPRLVRTTGNGRKATWLELFYDLVYVVAIFQLSHILSDHLTVEHVLQYVLLFVPVWWVWVGSTVYNNRFETNDLSQRLFTFVKVLALCGMALSVHDAFGHLGEFFALSYALARSVIILLWVRAAYHIKEVRPTAHIYVVGFSISVLLWAGSALVVGPLRYWMWVAGIFCDLVTPALTISRQQKLPRFDSSHLPERYGLFTIIAIGETVIDVFLGLSGAEIEAMVGVLAALGLGISFFVWWLYFDNIMNHEYRPDAGMVMAWAYLHLPLLMSITAMGAGILYALVHGEGLLLGVGAGATLLSLALIERTLAQEEETQCGTRMGKVSLYVGAILACVLGFLSLPVVALMVGVLVILGVQVGYTVVHVRHHH